MLSVALSAEFIAAIIRLSFHNEGVYDLMVLWYNEKDIKFEEEIIADLQEEIEDILQCVYAKNSRK